MIFAAAWAGRFSRTRQIRARWRNADHRRFHCVPDDRIWASQWHHLWNIPKNLAARGTILRGMITDHRSPLVYGFEGKDLPVYFNQDPVISQTQSAFFDVAAVPECVQLWPKRHTQCHAGSHFAIRSQRCHSQSSGSFRCQDDSPRQQRGWSQGPEAEEVRPRVVMQFPAKPDDMLLSGMLAGGQHLSTVSCLPMFRWVKAHCRVRSSTFLALANARDFLSTLQRDSELERSRCGQN